MNKLIATSTIGLLLSLVSKAETINIRCSAIPFLNSATITAVVVSDNQDARVSLAGTIKRQGDQYQPQAVSASMSGHIVSSQGLPDAQGNAVQFKSVFAVADAGQVRRFQLSIGANGGIHADSFIQTDDGVYFRANCRAE